MQRALKQRPGWRKGARCARGGTSQAPAFSQGACPIVINRTGSLGLGPGWGAGRLTGMRKPTTHRQPSHSQRPDHRGSPPSGLTLCQRPRIRFGLRSPSRRPRPWSPWTARGASAWCASTGMASWTSCGNPRRQTRPGRGSANSAAVRELAEETGVSAKALDLLGVSTSPLPGLFNEVIHLYHGARPWTCPGPPAPDPDEELELQWLAGWPSAIAMVLRGEWKDGKPAWGSGAPNTTCNCDGTPASAGLS